MASINLKINIIDLRKLKIMNFLETLPIEDVCKEIKQKIADEGLDTTEFSLFSRTLSKWLLPNKCLAFYNLNTDSELEFKSKFRILRVRCMDDAVKTMHIDESQPVQPLVLSICKKLGISNPEEYSFALDDIKNSKKNYHPSEDPVIFLNSTKTLPEQGVPENSTLLLRKAFHFSDSNIDCDDPIQLNFLYVQAKNAVVSGRYPCSLEELIEFAAIQSQTTNGNYEEAKMKVGLLNLKEYLPDGYRKSKDIEKKIFQTQKKLENISDINLKFRYVKLCRSLKSYGVTFFSAKEQRSKSSKLHDVLIGISKDNIFRFDSESKEILQSWSLLNLRRWVASPNTFTLDFGEYNQSLYSLQTTRGEQMSFIIGGYIDILMKRKLALEKINYPEIQEGGKDTSTIPTSSQGFVLEPASAIIPVQETTITHLGTMAITSGAQTLASKPKSEKKKPPRPKSKNPVEHLNYQMYKADGPLNVLEAISISPDTPVSDQDTKAFSSHSLTALLSSFLASTVVLSECAMKNNADGILTELKSLVNLLAPLAEACSKFHNPATQAAANQLSVVTRELFLAIEETIRTDQNKDIILNKTVNVTRVVHSLLSTLPSLILPPDQFNAMKINSEFLVAGNQELLKRSNQFAANSASQATAADFNKLITSHSELTQHLETIFNTVSNLISTPHCSNQCTLAIRSLKNSQNDITKLSNDENSEEFSTVSSITETLSKAYEMFLDQMERGNFKQDIEMELLFKKIENKGKFVQNSIQGDAPILIKNTKILTKTSADLVALLKRRINTCQNEDTIKKFKDVKSSLTECTTKMVECTKMVAANPNVDEFNDRLYHAVEELVTVAGSIIPQEVIEPSEYVETPLRNISFTTALLSNHLTTSQVPQTMEAVYQIKDCNKRYATEYSNSAKDKRILLANDMAVSARTLLKACAEDGTIEAPEEFEVDLKLCHKTLGQLEYGLQKYSDSTDIFELNSMAEKLQDLRMKSQNVQQVQDPKVQEFDKFESHLIEFRNSIEQIQNFLKVKPKETGYSGIMKPIMEHLNSIAQSGLQDREKINEILMKAQEIMKVSSQVGSDPEKEEQLNFALSQLQNANSSLIESTEKLRKSNQHADPREAIIESIVDVKSSIAILSQAHLKNKDMDKQTAEFEMAFDKFNFTSQKILFGTFSDSSIKERLTKTLRVINEKKEAFKNQLKTSPSQKDDAQEAVDPTLEELNEAMQEYLKECIKLNIGVDPADLQVVQKLSDAQEMVNRDSSMGDSDISNYADASERITGTAAVITELIKQRVNGDNSMNSSSSSLEICKKLNYLIKAGVEASDSVALIDSKKTAHQCDDVFTYLKMIENADSKTASIQSASYLGHASSSLCIDLKVQAESSTLPKTDAEKLNNFSIEIASKTKDILLATKMIGKTTSAEAIQVPSNELREKLEELLTYINSSALPIRENLKEVSNACKLFVLCQDPERLPINATRIELAMNHLIRSLQRATPGQQEISAATDQILLGINQIDDSLLKCTMKEGLQIKLEHQPQLLSDVANMKDMLQAYNENRSPELALQLATSYFQFTKLATDSGIFELVHKFGDSMIQMLVKKENTDATRLCDELLSVLELRKKFHQIMNQDSEENLKDNPEYDYEHLCSASKSFLTSVSQGDKKVDDYFKILCGAVKRSKLGTNSPKLQNCVDQSFQRVASTALLVLLNGEKPTALSSPISFLIAAVKECTRTSSQCDKAIKEIELLIPVVDTWAAAPVSAITPDTSVISKCGQLNECLNSVMVTVKESDEATFGDAVNSSLIVLKGLLDACSKSKNENMKENCKRFLALWAPFLDLSRNTLFKPESHRNWAELKSMFDNIQESIQSLHIQRLPDVFSTMTGQIQAVFHSCNFHPSFIECARDVFTEALDLLLAAAACQKEISKAPVKEMYFNDGTWSEGLISAAEKVVENILILYSYFCDPQQTRILACGKSNQASIKQLTSAASVRVSMNSPSLETLHHRARKLHNTFDNIMKTLPDDTKGSLKSVKSQNLNQIALIEAQAEVFEIEKELDKARERYTNLKKKRYTEPS